MFRKLTFLFLNLSKLYFLRTTQVFILFIRGERKLRTPLYIHRSTNLYIMRSKCSWRKDIFVFPNDVIVASPDLQSGYLNPQENLTTPPSAFETCHIMKGKIRGKEENQIHHMSGSYACPYEKPPS